VQAVYHADFEKNIRGTLTSVTDDPEMKRVKEVANVISQAAYTRRRSDSDNAETEHRFCEPDSLTPKCFHALILYLHCQSDMMRATRLVLAPYLLVMDGH